MSITINNSQNDVSITENNGSLEIIDNNTATSVNIPIEISTIATIASQGPKGDKGDKGDIGTAGSTLSIPAGNIVQPFVHVTASGNISASGDATLNKIFVKDDYALELQATSAGPRIFFGATTDTDTFMSFGAYAGINNLDTETRDFHIFGSNTTTGLYFDESAGNVGIGTTTPTKKLTVEGNISASGTGTFGGDVTLGPAGGLSRFLAASDGDPANATFTDISSTTAGMAIVNDAVHLIQGDNPKLTLSGSRFGIGTQTPGESLEVVGNISASGDGLFNSVGIGTANPFGKLNIYTSGSQATGSNAAINIYSHNFDASLRFGFSAATVGHEIKYKGIDGGNNNDLEFISEGYPGDESTKWMNVKQDGQVALGSGSLNDGAGIIFLPGSGSAYAGNVGVGTTTPGAKLEVVGNISSSGTIYASGLNLEGANITYRAQDDLLKFGDGIKLGIGAGPVAETADLIISSDGANVTLGAGVGDVTVTTSGGDTIIKNNTATGNILLQSDKNPAGYGGGSVMISGSNTTVKLDVRGNITASGTIQSEGNITTAGTLTAGNIELPPGGAIRPTINNNTISFRSAAHGSGEFMEIGSDAFRVYMNGQLYINHTPTTLTMNSATTDQDIRINYQNGDAAFISDGASHFTRMSGPIVISRSGSATATTPLGSGFSAVTDGESALQLSGSLYANGTITASGDISSSGDVYASNIILPNNGMIAPSENNKAIRFMTKPPGTADNGEIFTLSQDLIEFKGATGTATPYSLLKLDLTNGAESILFNEESNDVDFKIKSNSTIAFNLKADADMMAFRNHVGIGYSSAKWPTDDYTLSGTPDKQLMVAGVTHLTGSVEIIGPITTHVTASGNISSSMTLTAKQLIVNYDSIATSDPNVKGQVYRNGSNQLFISAG